MRRYLAYGQPREESGTGFPTHDRTGTSRFLTRDQRVVFSSDAAHHKCRPSQSNLSIRFRLSFVRHLGYFIIIYINRLGLGKLHTSATSCTLHSI